jgi:hypothetical protein
MRSRCLEAKLGFGGTCAESSRILILSAGPRLAVLFVLFHRSLLSFVLRVRSIFLHFHQLTAGLCSLPSTHILQDVRQNYSHERAAQRCICW